MRIGTRVSGALATEELRARGGKSLWFLGGFFEAEFAKRLRGSIFIQPEDVSRIMTEKDPENIPGLLAGFEKIFPPRVIRKIFAERRCVLRSAGAS